MATENYGVVAESDVMDSLIIDSLIIGGASEVASRIATQLADAFAELAENTAKTARQERSLVYDMYVGASAMLDIAEAYENAMEFIDYAGRVYGSYREVIRQAFVFAYRMEALNQRWCRSVVSHKIDSAARIAGRLADDLDRAFSSSPLPED